MRRVMAFVFGVSFATAAGAQCVRYECKRSVDTVSCWERVGPLASEYRLGSSCSTEEKCIWSYVPDRGWGATCSYDCVIDPCYEV
jgi:hypothetical protein